jgi:hypothetical protein
MEGAQGSRLAKAQEDQSMKKLGGQSLQKAPGTKSLKIFIQQKREMVKAKPQDDTLIYVKEEKKELDLVQKHKTPDID